ncbi:DUF4331 domain-containing protein [Profundibacterium mesophilum]|uniref:DUF4331 domain-containing protein n=1 Tax=Profundibacterium mesophilum KAUST100406-0324 TaxID=1037889 RepID=A0A921NR16_9RHOB|nr:DUF4331 domain-containing protein [Profundibacterium mesophilum]KAF0675827.1 hypothetical protein PMES_01913 [Profundibacterium mesophilum KAUST100406-0324]
MIYRKTMVFGTTMALALSATAMSGWASSHREAPAITKTPKVDGTDFYMFRSYQEGRSDYVTLIANYQPLQEPYGGPNYFTMDPDAVYEIHIDNDGDAREDITFQFRFDNDLIMNGEGFKLPVGPDGDKKDIAIPLRQFAPIFKNDIGGLNERETYQVTRITGDRRSGAGAPLKRAGTSNLVFEKPVDNIGQKTLPDYAAYANARVYDVDIPGCNMTGRVFAGQRAEAFAVNLGEIFDLVNLAPIEGDSAPGADDDGGFNGGITQDRSNDDLVGTHNVTSLALEVPISCLTNGTDAVIGAWTTASVPQAELQDPSPSYEQDSVFGGAYVQQSRLSAPLVNEVVVGLKDKNLFNAAQPTIDSALIDYVTNPTLPELIEILFGGKFGLPQTLAPNNFPRNDLVAAFLTGFDGFNKPSGDSFQPSEMMRLNTAVPATPRNQQSNLGVLGEDIAGFPNGRRPGDDVVDIALRVVMGRLCYPVPLGAELTGNPGIEDTDDDNINLGFCKPEDAPVGMANFTDGAPISAAQLGNFFPYLNTPIPGSYSN